MNSNKRNAQQCHSYLVPNLFCAPTIHCIICLFPHCYCNRGEDLKAVNFCNATTRNERQVFVRELKVWPPEACVSAPQTFKSESLCPGTAKLLSCDERNLFLTMRRVALLFILSDSQVVFLKSVKKPLFHKFLLGFKLHFLH